MMSNHLNSNISVIGKLPRESPFPESGNIRGEKWIGRIMEKRTVGRPSEQISLDGMGIRERIGGRGGLENKNGWKTGRAQRRHLQD